MVEGKGREKAVMAAPAGTKPARLVPWTINDLRRTAATGLQRLGTVAHCCRPWLKPAVVSLF
jgi:hypothetical protein